MERIRSILVNTVETLILNRLMRNDSENKSTCTSIAETLQVIRRVLSIRQDITYSFCVTGAETEGPYIKSKTTAKLYG